MLFKKHKDYDYYGMIPQKPPLKRSDQHISSKNPILCDGPKCTHDPRFHATTASVEHPWITPQQQQRYSKFQRSPIIGGIKVRQLFDKYPTKDELRRVITEWTGNTYVIITEARRKKNPEIKPEYLRVDWAMAAYMRDFSLRAPTMPIKARNPLNQTYQSAPRYLYRGVSWSIPLGKSLMDASYTSWSTNPQTGARFGLGKSLRGPESTRVYRLDISTIPRGTPWIWFSGKGARLQNGWNISFMEDRESEVILPPGTLTLVNTSKISMAGRRVGALVGNGRATVIDVRFQPDRNATTLWKPPNGQRLRIFK